MISDEEYYQIIRGRNAGGYNHYFRGLIREITPKMDESIPPICLNGHSMYHLLQRHVSLKKEGKKNRVLSLRSNPLAAAKSNPYFLPRRSTRKNFGKRKSEFDSPAILDVDGIDDDEKQIISHDIKNPMTVIAESDVESEVESKSDPKIDDIANSFDEEANDNHLHFGSSHKLVPPDIGAPDTGPRRSQRLKDKYAVKPRLNMDESNVFVADNLGRLDHVIEIPPSNEPAHDMDDMASIIADGERIDKSNLTDVQRKIIEDALKIARRAKQYENSDQVRISDDYVIDRDIADALQNPEIARSRDDYDEYKMAPYLLRNRIFQGALLKDPAIKDANRFTIKSIHQNQMEFPPYGILRRVLNGVDVKNELETLSLSIRKGVKSGKYSINRDELITYTGDDGVHRICLPPEHRKAIMRWTHTNLLHGGHAGISAVTAEIRRRFYWNGYQRDIHDFVSSCKCQMAKDQPSNKQKEMILFPARSINESVAIDHAGVLPETPDGAQYITTIICRNSDFSKSIPTKSIDAFTTAMNFVMHWVCPYGPPKSILTDNGSDFRSELMNHLCSMIHTDHSFTVAHHASTNGAVERHNKVIKKILRIIGMKKNLNFAKGDSWDLYIPIVDAIHNNQLSRRTRFKLSPNDIFLGRRIRTPLDWELNIKDELYVEDNINPMDT